MSQPDADQAPPQRQRLALGAAIGVVLLVGAALGWRLIESPDFGWHLSYARWILDHGKVPTTDPLTYTVSDRAATDPQWGYQIILHTIMSVGGPAAVTIATTGLTLAFAGLLLWRTFRREGRLPLGVVPLLLLFFLGNGWEVRPHIASWLAGSAVLLVLEEYARGNRRWLWALPAIMLAWVNLHAVFILGLVIIASYGFAEVVTALRAKRSIDRKLLIVAGASLAACLINPYHVHALLLPWAQLGDLQSGSVFKSALTGTGEYLSPFRFDRYAPEDGPFVMFHAFLYWQLFTALVLIGAAGCIKRAGLVDWILLAGFLYLFASANKNFGFFVMVALPMTAGGLSRATALAARGKVAGPFAWAVGWSAVGLVCLALAWSGWFYSVAWSSARRGFGLNEVSLPVGACAFINEHNITGRILNTWNDGGYIAWATGQPVFIYGRGRVMGPDFYTEYVEAKKPGKFEQLLSRYQPTVAIVRNSVTPYWLFRLNTLGQWRIVYADDSTTLFCHASVAPNVPAIAPPKPGADYPPHPADQLPAQIERVTQLPPAGAAQFIAGRRAYPVEQMRRSRRYVGLQQWSACIGVSIDGLRRAGFAVPDLLVHLGHAFDAKREYRLADQCYDAYLRVESNPETIRLIQSIRADRRRTGGRR